MDQTTDSKLFSRISLAVILVFVSGSFWRIGISVLRDQALFPYEKFILGLGFLFAIIGILYVSYQRFEMRKSEGFRREKW